MNTYVLITAARNEEAYIEKTIQAVIAQTVLPVKWVIVSDGSTDRTDEIVNNYAAKHNFIELAQNPGSRKRQYGSKVRAFNLGYQQLKETEYEFIGNLDADISFESHYYEKVLKKFNDKKELGIAGGVRYDLRNGKFELVKRSLNSVSGAYQLFRRQCYETIGGYLPLAGGIDAVAENMARMKGWQAVAFTDLPVYHYRGVGAANLNSLSVKFIGGINDYLIGYHPLFQIVRNLYSIFQKPVFGSLLRTCGYFWALSKRSKKPVSSDYVKYLRSEQLIRLKSLLLTGKDTVMKV